MANRKLTALAALVNLAATGRLYAAEGGFPYQISPENMSRAMFAHLPVWDLDTDIATSTTTGSGAPVNGTVSGTAPQFILDMTNPAAQFSVEVVNPAVTISAAPRVLELTSWQAITGTLANGTVIIGLSDSANTPSDILTQFGGGQVDNTFLITGVALSGGGVGIQVLGYIGGVAQFAVTTTVAGADENTPLFIRYRGSLSALVLEAYCGTKLLHRATMDFSALAGLKPFMGLLSNDTTVDLQATANISAPSWVGLPTAPATQGAVTYPTDNAGRAYRIAATGDKIVAGPITVRDDDIVIFDDAGGNTFYALPSRLNAIEYDASIDVGAFLSKVRQESVLDFVLSGTLTADGERVFSTFSSLYAHIVSLDIVAEKRVWVIDSTDATSGKATIDAGTYDLRTHQVSFHGIKPLAADGNPVMLLQVAEGVSFTSWHFAESIELRSLATTTTPFQPSDDAEYRFGDYVFLNGGGTTPMFEATASTAPITLVLGARCTLSGTGMLSWTGTPASTTITIIAGAFASFGSGIVDSGAPTPSGAPVAIALGGPASTSAIEDLATVNLDSGFKVDHFVTSNGPAGANFSLNKNLERTEIRHKFRLTGSGTLDNSFVFGSLQTLLDYAASIKSMTTALGGASTVLHVLEIVLDETLNGVSINIDAIDWTDTNAAGWEAIVFTHDGAAAEFGLQIGSGTFGALTTAGAASVVFRNVVVSHAAIGDLFDGTSDPVIIFENSSWDGGASSSNFRSGTTATTYFRGGCRLTGSASSDAFMHLTGTTTFEVQDGCLVIGDTALGSGSLGTLNITAKGGGAAIDTQVRNALGTLNISVVNGYALDSEFVNIADTQFISGNNSLRDFADFAWARGIRSAVFTASDTLRANTVALVGTNTAAITLTLDDTSIPTITLGGWPVHIIVDKDGNAATNNITVDPAGGQNINGAGALTINTANAVWLVGRDSASTWFAIQIA